MQLDSDLVLQEIESVGQDCPQGRIEMPRRGVRSRSFFQISDEYKDITLRAAAQIRSYTYFENPMLKAEELSLLIQDAWEKAKKETGKMVERTKVIDSHVS